MSGLEKNLTYLVQIAMYIFSTLFNYISVGFSLRAGYTEINLDTFRKITRGKPDGFIVPFDIHVGSSLWKKGQIAKEYKFKYNNDGITKAYAVDDNKGVLPEEIVERWEAFYSKEEMILLGDKKVEVYIGKGYIKEDGKSYSIDQLEALYNRLQIEPIEGIPITVSTVKIGCTTCKVSELENMIYTYKRINQ